MQRAAVILGGTWWVAAAVLGGLRWVDAGGVLPALQSGVALVGLSLPALVLRAWWLAMATVLLGVPWIALALPWWTADAELARPADTDMVVLVSNLQYGEADLRAVEQLVVEQQVEALVLLEVTPEVVAALTGSTIVERLPHRSGEPRYDAGGTLVLTADPHRQVPAPAPMSFGQVAVRIDGEAGDWTLLGAHPVPPLDTGRWRRELATIGQWVDSRGSNEPLVVAGDLNASRAHPAYRQAVDGMQDAHEVVGAGWVRTWPVESVIPAYVQLDHVLTQGFGVVAAGSAPVTGTDHAAVWARLAQSTG